MMPMNLECPVEEGGSSNSFYLGAEQSPKASPRMEFCNDFLNELGFLR